MGAVLIKLSLNECCIFVTKGNNKSWGTWLSSECGNYQLLLQLIFRYLTERRRVISFLHSFISNSWRPHRRRWLLTDWCWVLVGQAIVTQLVVERKFSLELYQNTPKQLQPFLKAFNYSEVFIIFSISGCLYINLNWVSLNRAFQTQLTISTVHNLTIIIYNHNKNQKANDAYSIH